MKANASPAHHDHRLLAMIGGFLIGVLEAFSVVVGLVFLVVAIAALLVGDSYWGGFIIGYYGGPVLLVLVPVALLVVGVLEARRATRPRPPQREARRVHGSSHWERFLYYFGLKRDPPALAPLRLRELPSGQRP